MLLAAWNWIESHSQLVAAAVALLAFLVAISQAAFARAHNRTSVRPYLSLDKHTTQGAGFGGRALPALEITLRNAGLGPAVIVSASMSKNFGQYVPIREAETIKMCDELLKAPIPKAVTHELRRDMILAKDEKITLLGFESKTPEQGTALYESLRSFSFQAKIYYKSLHGELFLLDNCDKYSRNKRVLQIFGVVVSSHHRAELNAFGAQI
ncbi:MAG: hypothetical protein EAZ30_02140 [Betaproteobacteria bacterium]|nr:MAG: hypothetical protein EAZ30_02140 [Betaproteobacteria bacterium]